MLIHRNVIKSLHPATDASDTRYALGGIYVDPDTRECVATDGHILIRAAAPSADPNTDFPSRINGDSPIDATADVVGLLDAGALLTAAKATPRKALTPVLANVAVTSPTTFVTTDLEHSGTLGAADMQDRSFPEWKRVFTGKPAGANSFTLSADLLAVLVKVAKAQGLGRDAHVTFHITPDQGTNGVCFDIGPSTDSPKIDGIVMPMKGGR